jgi:predicted nucleic acid-binding protein
MIGIDTNILVYAFDESEPVKRGPCMQLFIEIIEGRKQGAITNQVLAEFCSVMTRKVDRPRTHQEISYIIGAIITSANWTVLDYTSETVLNALRAKIPFWDSLIAQTLKEHGVGTIVTENVKRFKGSGIKAVSPF